MMHAEKRSLNISRETERLKEELIQLKEDSEANHEKSNEPQMEEDDTSAAMDFERSAETFMVVDDNEKTPS
uniref:Uncharacterized protein n=1 Tax=Panagrolaimus superbus TaxID=310955 RepID=A0A914YF49_9BILA